MVPNTCDPQFTVHCSPLLAKALLDGTIACLIALLMFSVQIRADVRKDRANLETIRGDANTAFAKIACVAAVISLWLGCATFGDSSSGSPFATGFPFATKLKVALLAAWILGPPITFLFEFLVFTEKGRSVPDRFKYEQDAKAKVWIAVSTVMTILFFGKDLALKGQP
jgi:hypothetical protein